MHSHIHRIRCHINKNNAVVAASLIEEAADLLSKYSNSSNIGKMIKASNIISSSSEMVSMKALSSVLASINRSIDNFNSDNIDGLSKARSDAFAIILTNMLKFEGATRRLELHK